MATEARDGPGPEGRTAPSIPEGAPHPPFSYIQSTEHWALEDSSQALNPNGICPTGTGDWFIPSSSSLLQWGHLSYACLTSNWISRFTACKQLQWAVMASLGRDEGRTESRQALRQVAVSEK